MQNLLYYHTKPEITSTKIIAMFDAGTTPTSKLEAMNTLTNESLEMIDAISHFEQRATFCGSLLQVDETSVQLSVGVSLCSGNDQFSRKKGRSISKHRAIHCPLSVTTVSPDEIVPTFHRMIGELLPVVRKHKHTMCDITELVQSESHILALKKAYHTKETELQDLGVI